LVELPRILDRVRAETRAAGRDPAAMEFTAGGARTVDEATVYAEFGVHRLTVAIRARSVVDMRNEVARLGDELVAKTIDL
jgi:hypothetical protein